MNTIGENIVKLRKQKGLTQEALANAIGVSAQSISKWENNTNMPDIMLLPIIADVFDISIDDLFGQKGHIYNTYNPDTALEVCCDKMLETILSCAFDPNCVNPYEEVLCNYKKNIKRNTDMRTAIIKKHGTVYYRDNIGGIILKKSKNKWYELLDNDEAIDLIKLLSNDDFRNALIEILKSQKTNFTLPSLCNKCEISNIAELEENFDKSKLFVKKTVDIDSNSVVIYEFIGQEKMFLIFAVFTYALEYQEYKSIYNVYYGEVNNCFEKMLTSFF